MAEIAFRLFLTVSAGSFPETWLPALADSRKLASLILLTFPECRREQRQGGKYLQPPEQHAACQYYASEGVDSLKALRSSNLGKARTYHVEGGRYRSRRRNKGEVFLKRHEDRCQGEHGNPSGEEPQNRYAYPLGHHATRYL